MARTIYADREEAGKVLAEAIRPLLIGEKPAPERPLVLAIPRGGVMVGLEVTKVLCADLDVVVPRKLGAPMEPEFAIGAVMHDGTSYLNEQAIRITGADGSYLAAEVSRQIEEAKRRLHAYRGARQEPQMGGRTVIVVDDGVATGATMLVALRWVRSRGARLVIAATPVAPQSTLAAMRTEADRIVCPHTPEPFQAIGWFYRDFQQITDEQVMRALRGA